MSQLTSSIQENPKLRAAAEELKKAGIKVGDAVSEALKTMEESDVMRAVRVSPSRSRHMLMAADFACICCCFLDHRKVDGTYKKYRCV